MKVHYINILLFALPLNIWVNTHKRKQSITPRHTKTNRTLCECALYASANYDNDAEMKKVMQQFEDRTTQRFHEYDERMKTTRQKCKEQCDKEIQKIILKDKLEKELMDKFATLDTDIQSDAIPTCLCEKSMADKMEKTCLKCIQNIGGIVAPSSGVLAGIAEAELIVWKPLAIAAAKAAAETEATALATQAGMREVILQLKQFLKLFTPEEGLVNLIPMINKSNYKCGSALFQNAKDIVSKSCFNKLTGSDYSFCNTVRNSGESTFKNLAQAGAEVYEKTLASQTTTLTEANVGAVKATYAGYEITIIASVVAIVVIVLIMVIIYLILRHRRKKKMKKKLQYIKLLEE
ncbi:PIR protein [Plasmodium sp. DRC-Itaito]|nr:PIR protein [Plasmodium sp. DRC-Itaito]